MLITMSQAQVPAARSGQAAAATPPTTTPPSPRSVIGRVALLVGIVLVVFVGILPRVVDYDAVGAALSGLSAGQLAVLAVATAIAYVARAAPSRRDARWGLLPRSPAS